MSLRTFSKILPVIANSLKGKHTKFNQPLLSKFCEYPASAVNLCNHIDFKLHSTKPRSVNKQIYYGVLTPQIKAVKVRENFFACICS